MINNRIAGGEIFFYNWFGFVTFERKERGGGGGEIKSKQYVSKTYLNWYDQNEIFQRKFLSFISYFVITVKKE